MELNVTPLWLALCSAGKGLITWVTLLKDEVLSLLRGLMVYWSKGFHLVTHSLFTFYSLYSLQSFLLRLCQLLSSAPCLLIFWENPQCKLFGKHLVMLFGWLKYLLPLMLMVNPEALVVGFSDSLALFSQVEQPEDSSQASSSCSQTLRLWGDMREGVAHRRALLGLCLVWNEKT